MGSQNLGNRLYSLVVLALYFITTQDHYLFFQDLKYSQLKCLIIPSSIDLKINQVEIKREGKEDKPRLNQPSFFIYLFFLHFWYFYFRFFAPIAHAGNSGTEILQSLKIV